MRLWHIDLIPYLPKSQLLAQWRELNSILKKQDNHILINYIYDYNKEVLHDYTVSVMQEMNNRGYKIYNTENYINYFILDGIVGNCFKRFKEHDNEYLTICYYNLKEKYLRGQKDFDEETWTRLDKFYKKYIKENK